MGSSGRQSIQIRNVLQNGDRRRRQCLMNRKVGRGSWIDARRVDADGPNTASYQPLGGIGSEPGKMQIVGPPRRVVSEIPQRVRPTPTPARADQYGRAGCDGTVPTLKGIEVGRRNGVVGIGLALPNGIDYGNGAYKVLQLQLTNSRFAFGEMDRSVEVSA